jgi:thiopeptide-type bacteriocin biosynthesis protein
MTAAVDSGPGTGPRRAAKAKRGPAYRPLGWAALRAPLLPVEAYGRVMGATADERLRWLEDDLVATALFAGSDDLAAGTERGVHRLSPKDRRRLDASLLRYLTRMSTRPTPYGMFAGVALVAWGERTTAELDGPPRTHTRPDMSWLGALLAVTAADAAVVPRLRVTRHRSAVVRDGRVALADMPRGPTVRATPAVLRALELADRPVPYARLAAALSERPGATGEKVAALLDELLRCSLLVPQLRPSILTTDPAGEALAALTEIDPDGERTRGLAAVLDAAATFDRTAAAGAPRAPALVAVRAAAGRLNPDGTPLQVDLTWSVRGDVSARVADAAGRAVETLLTVAPTDAGPTRLQAYRHAFESRYGRDGLVPLLDLADAATGLGLPQHLGHGGHTPASDGRAERRSRALYHLATTALRDRSSVVVLSPDDVDDLRAADLGEHELPLSVDVSLFVLARSAADVDAGQFQVMIGPNLGGQAAGRNLGRFAGALGERGLAALREVDERERELAPDRLWAEVVYEPSRLRSANVTVRPDCRRHRIVPWRDGSDDERSIALDELAVGLDGDRLRVVWQADGREVVPCSTHMLNPAGAPPAVALLAELARDGQAPLATFDWGPAASLPTLPRVVYRDVVLRPAQWNLDAGALRLKPGDTDRGHVAAAVQAWREWWDVPRQVYLTMGDNRLLLDLEDPLGVDELRRELGRVRPGRHLALQEPLPGPEHAWLQGPGGSYICELMVPLVRARPEPGSTRQLPARPAAMGPGQRPTALSVPRALIERTKLPGSDWLFAKLYGAAEGEDAVLRGPVRELIDVAVLGGAAKEWFFLRYSDPDPHLRLRFHGEPSRLTDLLLPQLFAWAGRLHDAGLCTSLVVDTYDREVDRYGGPAAIGPAESVFCADSAAVVDMLDALAAHPDVDPLTLACVSVDDLLGSLGYGVAERADWYAAQVRDRRASGEEYRRLGNGLRSLLGTPAAAPTELGGDVAAAFASRRERVAGPAARIAALESQGVLTLSRDAVVASLVHMHCNRLLGRQTREDVVLGVLLRTWQGLQRR